MLTTVRRKAVLPLAYQPVLRDDVDITENQSRTPSSDHSSLELTASQEEQLDQMLPINVASKTVAQQVSQDTHTRATESSVLRLWWSELGALLIAIAAFAAMVVLALPYHGSTPQPDWPSSITLNTVISILSIFLRAGLVYAIAEALSQQKWLWFRQGRYLFDLPAFDQATRGPLGALMLLGRPSTWRTMPIYGAILMLITIAIGPFAQQILTFEGCLLPSETRTASIPRQRMYTASGYELQTPKYGGAQRPDVSGPPLDIQVSVYAGIFAPQSNVVPVFCQSGNCTFPETYKSLAYCAFCNDVSDQLVYSLRDYTDPATNATYPISNWTLPSGNNVHATNNSGYGSVDMVSAVIPTGSLEYWSVNRTYEVIWQDDSPPKCTDQQKSDNPSSWKCRGAGAASCTLGPCVRVYSAEMKDNVFTETLLRVATGMNLESLVDVPCLSEVVRQQLIDKGRLSLNMTDFAPNLGYYGDSLEYPGYLYQNASDYDFDFVPAECVYQISWEAQASIINWLVHVLTGSVSKGMAVYEGFNYISAPDVMLKLYNDNSPSFSSVSGFFQNVSDGMTTNIRMRGNSTTDGWGQSIPTETQERLFAGNQPVIGIVSDNRVCVHVHWLWLTYPAALIILAIIFVLVTMFDKSLYKRVPGSLHEGKDTHQPQSRLRPAGVWKSSMLPLMFHGLEDNTLRCIDPSRLVSVDEMERTAKEMKARLTRAEDGWKLVKVE